MLSRLHNGDIDMTDKKSLRGRPRTGAQPVEQGFAWDLDLAQNLMVRFVNHPPEAPWPHDLARWRLNGGTFTDDVAQKLQALLRGSLTHLVKHGGLPPGG